MKTTKPSTLPDATSFGTFQANLTSVLVSSFLLMGIACGEDLSPAAEHIAMPMDTENMSTLHHAMVMPGLLGSYAMSRDASGTGWQPDSASADGIHSMSNLWMTMWHGSLTSVYTHQGGPRGGSENYSESMLMFMGRRSMGADALGIRVMLSGEPTMGARGYPLLFQTGETANGQDPLVDRQHPHNLLMELAVTYSKPLSSVSSVFIYGGPVGEPALGPAAFMHRFSSDLNPEAPLTHHWLDATHTTFGVLTVGGVWHNVKVDASAFNGREPNEHRYEIQLRSFDSSSARITYNATTHLSMQFSMGYLASPEELEPETSVRRTTASLVYDKAFAVSHWQTTLGWGHNRPSGLQRRSDGYLVDSALRFDMGTSLFARFEQVGKNELFAEGSALRGQAFTINKLSLGMSYDVAQTAHLRWTVGTLVSQHWIPAILTPMYGQDPTSYTLFIRTTLVR